jgi:protein phosphatase
MRSISAAVTDVGKKREVNEDFFVADDVLGLYAVADGVGGHARGEVASKEAISELEMWVRRHVPDIDAAFAEGRDEGFAKVGRLLESGVQSACYMVFGLGEQDPDKRGMATTMSVLLVRGAYAVLAQVGDSRVYRLRGGQVEQLTEDHTLVNYKLKLGLISEAEAKTTSAKNVITRAVGHKDYVQVDIVHETVMVHDRYLLCTDGLHGYLDDTAQVHSLMTKDPLDLAAHAAVEFANDCGGQDNSTALLVAIRP